MSIRCAKLSELRSLVTYKPISNWIAAELQMHLRCTGQLLMIKCFIKYLYGNVPLSECLLDHVAWSEQWQPTATVKTVFLIRPHKFKAKLWHSDEISVWAKKLSMFASYQLKKIIISLFAAGLLRKILLKLGWEILCPHFLARSKLIILPEQVITRRTVLLHRKSIMC